MTISERKSVLENLLSNSFRTIKRRKKTTKLWNLTGVYKVKQKVMIIEKRKVKFQLLNQYIIIHRI